MGEETARPVSLTDERAHDPGRFSRGVALALKPGHVEAVGPQQYRVKGNDEAWYDVDLSADVPCYCADSWHRGRAIRNNCKHVIAARLAAQDPAIMQSLMEYAYQLEQRKAS